METTPNESSVFKKIHAYCSSSSAERLWKSKRSEILNELLQDVALTNAVGKDANMVRLLKRSRERGCIDIALKTALSDKKYPPAGRKDLCEAFLRKKYNEFHREGISEQWVILVLMHCIGSALPLPAETFLTEEEVLSSLTDGQSISSLWKKQEAFIPFGAALSSLDEFSFYMKIHVENYALAQKKFSEQTVGSLKQIAEMESHLLELRRLHRIFLNGMRKLRTRLTIMIEGETLPLLSECLSSSGMELALSLERHMDAVREELFQACLKKIPPKFDAEALRTLLDCIIPPLMPRDRNLAEEEIGALADGDLTMEESPLLSVIFPVIRGEIEIDDDLIDERFPDFPYSGGMLAKLRKKNYSFSAVAEAEVNHSQEEEPSTMTGSELEPASVTDLSPENEILLASEALSESAPSVETNSESSTEEGLEPFIVAEVEPIQEPDQPLEEELEEEPASTPENTLDAEQEEEPEPSFETPKQSLDDIDSQMFGNAKTNFVAPKIIRETPSRPVPKTSDGMDRQMPLADSLASPPLSRQSATPSATETPHSHKIGDPMTEGIKKIIAGGSPVFPALEDASPADLVSQLILAKDSCALYWLAETLGEASPFPAWLAKLIHFGTQYQSRTVSLNPEIAELCDFASANMEDLDEKQKLLLAAALLRPALMMTEPPMIITTIATSLASSLSESYGLKPIMDGLCASVRSGTPLEDVPISKASSQTRAQQQAILKQETEEHITHAIRGKTNYQPATKAKQLLFKKDGPIGRLLYDCMDRELHSVQATLPHYEDKRNIQKLVPSHIEAAARENVIKDINIAIELVKKWLSFYGSEGKEKSSFAENQLEELNTAMGRQRAQLESCPEGLWFIQTMERLYARDSLGDVSPAKTLELWPLRLSCSKPECRTAFELPTLAQALLTRDFDKQEAVASSLAIHVAFGRISQVRDFIDHFPSLQDSGLSSSMLEEQMPMLAEAIPFTLDEIMDTSRKLWQEAFELELDRLKEYLGDSYFRGAIVYDQQSRLNVQISEIVARYSDTPDKALGIQELRALYTELQNWDRNRLEAVNLRISELQEKAASSDEAQAFLTELKQDVAVNQVFSAAWDNIARLENYLLQQGELPKLNAQRTSKLDTARDFYNNPENIWASKADKESARLWAKLCSFSPKHMEKSKFLGITTDFQRRLGFSLPLDVMPEEVFSEGSPNYWIVWRYNMTINSPLPQWGSGARGRHTIAFGWNVTPTNISNLVTSGRISAGEALTIVCCNELSHEARKEILRLSHKKWPVFPLVIDENLFLFLASQDEASRTEKLFEVALAGSPCNPYTPDVAGAVPREMFFGRENDKASIFNTAGSCIIYGGRQLGKSALLEQIYQEHLAKNDDIKIIKQGITRQDTSILEVVRRSCANAGVVNSNTTPKTFSANIKKWLEEKSGRRVLVLLDECDSILDEDSRNNFPDVEILRNLMQESGRSFKVVFTGLHSVQRFSLEPNSPLYHFGSNLCIGPLSTDAAYDLMTKPMQYLGLEFETRQLVQMALNYCNYQPKLIQMFCSELIKGIVNRIPARQPIHVIDRSTMLKVYDSQDLKTKIAECFTMTMALDTRYLVIGYTMALLQGEKVSISKLQSELRSYWPAAFAGEGGDITTLQSLLHEMEGLGLIISLGGSYRLRTPNIAELLGGQENVMLKLEQYYNQPYQPVADPDELRMGEASTLVASQYNLLADKVNRLCWISGSQALNLVKIPSTLKHIAEKAKEDPAYWGKMKYAALSGMSVTEAMKSLRGYYENLNEGGLIATISSSEFPHIPEFMKEAESWLVHLRTGRKYVKVICIVDPECLCEIIRNGLIDSVSSYQMPLRPWTKNSVDYWRKEKTLTGYDAVTLMNETGGWPCLISPILESGQKMPALNSLTANDFIPSAPEALHIVETMCALDGEPCPEDDLVELIGIPNGMTREGIRNHIEALKILHVLRETPKGLLLDSIAASVICGASS